MPNCKATDPATNSSVTLSDVWKLESTNRSRKFCQPTYVHPSRRLTSDTSCNEIYTFQKSGNIRKRSNITNAGVRNRYGSAILKMFLDNISHMMFKVQY
jgi:hypothetical protein